jgi:hypothetical protein
MKAEEVADDGGTSVVTNDRPQSGADATEGDRCPTCKGSGEHTLSFKGWNGPAVTYPPFPVALSFPPSTVARLVEHVGGHTFFCRDCGCLIDTACAEEEIESSPIAEVGPKAQFASANEFIDFYRRLGIAVGYTFSKRVKDADRKTAEALLNTEEEVARVERGLQLKNPIIATRPMNGKPGEPYLLLETDGPEMLERCRALGLQETLTGTSRNDVAAGHRHFVLKPPPDLRPDEHLRFRVEPATVNKNGTPIRGGFKSDIDGYLVCPPAAMVKEDGERHVYRWLDVSTPVARLTREEYGRLQEAVAKDKEQEAMRLTSDPEGAIPEGGGRNQHAHNLACALRAFDVPYELALEVCKATGEVVYTSLKEVRFEKQVKGAYDRHEPDEWRGRYPLARSLRKKGVLLEVALDCALRMNELCDDEFVRESEEEVEREVHRAYAEPIAAMVEPEPEHANVGEEPPAGAEPFALFNLVDIGEIMKSGFTEPTMLIEDLLVEGSHHLVFGPQEEGKTWVLTHIVALLLERGCTVAWIDKEMGRREVADRLTAFGLDPEVVHEQLIYSEFAAWDGGDRSRKEWAQLLEARKPTLVVVDAQMEVLGDADLSENVATDITKWHSWYLLPARERGGTTLMLDHTGHEEKHRARGGSAKGQIAKVAFLCRKLSHFDRETIGEIELERKKNTPSAPIPALQRFRIGGSADGFVFERDEFFDPAKDATTPPETEAFMRICHRLVDLVSENPGQTKSMLLDQVSGNTATKKKALAWSVEKGLIGRAKSAPRGQPFLLRG